MVFVDATAFIAMIAADAYAQFGKSRPALNIGDCYAYACAKSNRAKLLCKGDDFRGTDILVAGPLPMA